MTMRVTIKNEDDGRTVNVCEETYGIGKPSPSSQNTSRLGPGAEQSFYVHASKRLLVTEDPDATVAPR